MNFIPTTFISREKAERVIDQILKCEALYGVLTLYDYYSMLGHNVSLNYKKYGWVNLDKLDVYLSIGDDGFIVNLPDPIILDIGIEPKEPVVEKYCPYLPFSESGNYLSKPGSYTITKFPLCIGDSCAAYKNGECQRLANA